MKQLYKGIKNSQKIRVIVNGVGFHTTVKGTMDIVYTDHSAAVAVALSKISESRVQGYSSIGFGTRVVSYDSRMNRTETDVQVDIC